MQNEQRHIIALFEKDTKGERSVFSGFLRYSGANTSWDIRTIVPSSRNAASSLSNLLREWHPDGIVTSLRGFALLRRTTEPRLLRRAFVICIDSQEVDPSHAPNGIVQIDDAAVAKEACLSFLKKRYDSVAFVGTALPTEVPHSTVREAVFLQTARQDGVRAKAFRPGDSQPNRWIRELPRLAEWLATLPKPCGVMAYSDDRAMQVLDACRLAHLKVPEQIALIGVDNNAEFCEQMTPTLSSIAPDFEGAGLIAAKMFDAVFMSGRKPKRQLRRRYGVRTLVERESSLDLHGASRIVNTAQSYIRAHASTRIRPLVVANALHMSLRHLQRLFRDILGHTLQDEIINARLEVVKILLRTSGRTIKEIADACEFGSPTALMLLFKKRTGLSCGDYRHGGTSRGQTGMALE